MELEALARSRERSLKNSQFTVLIGRRRVGKTRLVLQSLDGEDYLYFFVSKKTEKLLCRDFAEEIQRTYGETVLGEVTEFQTIFKYLCRVAQQRTVHLFIDEFQEFTSINPSIYSDLQRDWDLNKDKMSMNLIVGGSIQSMMNRLFLDYKEPLFGRASSILRVQPFSLRTLKEIIRDHNPTVTAEDLLAIYTITGGVAQYVEYLVDNQALTHDAVFTAIYHPQSPLLTEGGNLLIRDVGKDHAVYFSILSLIASGFTTRPKIESVLQKPIGGYLTRLEKIYGILKRNRPIFSKENSTDIHFFIADNFLRFWFRFVHKYQNMVEANNLKALLEITKRDYRTYAGLTLESFMRQEMIESSNYTNIGNYWERGNKNEIDVVAVNELDRTAIIGEVKWQRDRVNLAKLEIKAEKMVRENLKGYQITYQAFGVEDIQVT